MRPLDSRILKKLLVQAGQKLRGDWVLIGGSLLPALGIDYRSTTDVDLIGLDNPDQTETLRLMEIADELGLPIETINQAGGYFLMKIEGFKKHLKILHCGPRATIYRPDYFLYVALKIGRMSESDLSDCLEYARFSKGEDKLPFQKLKVLIEKELVRSKGTAKEGRLKFLLNALREAPDS